MKQRMLDCFVTQRRTLSFFPVDVERFRRAPVYDFTQTPHAGTLYSEFFDRGMTAARWRDLARGDRKSAVSGKRVSVRVDLGGGRIIEKTSTNQQRRQPK